MDKRIDGRLGRSGNDYVITHGRPFSNGNYLKIDYVSKCVDFAYRMSFGDGEHRSHRTGGTHNRRAGEIFANTFQGKIAEFAMYQFLRDNNMTASEPDMSIAKLGEWDSFDLECYGQRIAVKSTKFYGQLLLLETQDWNEEGFYIPNLESGNAQYDEFVLIRISPSVEDVLKAQRLLYLDFIERKRIDEMIFSEEWRYDIAGYITHGDLKRLIEVQYILPKGATLNNKTKMDAENYYVQAGDMRDKSDFIKRMNYYKK